jgi:murein DD-endopeptidase MepM/ murein hydrolase activator NlpD
MSSLRQDRLHSEGSVPPTDTRSTPGTARGTTRRSTRSASPAADTTVPAPRQRATRPTASTTKSAPTKAAPAKAAKATKAVVVASAEVPVAPRPRPTPHKRTAAVEPAELTAAAETQAREAVVETGPAVVVDAPDTGLAAVAVVAEIADGRRRPFRHRVPSSRRRPALYLAVALAGALGVSLTTGESLPAQAQTQTVSHSVSVAEQLGIEAGASPIEEIPPGAVDDRLEELVVTRAERAAEQTEAQKAQADADRAAAEAARPKAVLPVAGARLTSVFGSRWGTLHAGIDLAAPMMTPEYAAMDGVVLEAGPASGFGNAVYIQHENGDVTVYGHMEQILVTAGQVVKAGDTIALLGNRGQSTGPHLHFEVHVGGINGTKIDPIPWLRERGVTIGS